MLQNLIVILRNAQSDPGACMGALLEWSRASPSLLDLELDLRTAAAAGALDEGFAGRLLAVLDDRERSDRAGLAEARRLEQDTAEKARQLADLVRRTGELKGEIAAAEARCMEQQRKLEEEEHDRQPESVPA
jgi:hypothetical protein